MKKTVYGILLAGIIGVVLFTTFQDPEGTVRLSEGIRLWLEKLGLYSDFHSFRSNAHLPLFFVFGLVLSLFGRENKWPCWMILLIGCGFGLLDEGVKVLIPTREFDVIDLIKNWIGVAIALFVVWLLRGIGVRKDD